MTVRISKALVCFTLALPFVAQAQTNWVAGPLYSEFRLTLSSGYRTEAAGPLYFSQLAETAQSWGIPPLFDYIHDPGVESTEFDLAYPLLTYDGYGKEYRFQILQLWNVAGGQSQDGTEARRTTLFPIYFQQRSPKPEENYTALVPFYGHLENRLFHDEIRFVMFPFYAETRKKDVVTDNYLYPFFHLRHGNELTGWQLWPLYGQEYKALTWKTNQLDESVPIGGHEKFFVLWPFYTRTWTGLGTTNPQSMFTVLPLYSQTRSPLRDSTSYGWPLGFTVTDDREKKYHEYDFPWPLFVFARGEGKTVNRVFPLFSRASNGTLESDWYLWPLYKYNAIHSPPLDRQRTRYGLFIYSDTQVRNTESGESSRRVDFWPFYTYRRELDGSTHLHALAVLEPFLPNVKAIEREYSPLWSLWRAERNPKTGAASQSLLWNLYRRESAPDAKKVSLLFGLFQYESNRAGGRVRLCYIPLGKAQPLPLDAKP